ncbi:hypothetical protein EX30DRAFT_345029 [Ascodesmis nigricans]|uniref:Uncharacterized protein n=1 Tax=Ascodesmis nigricans TaxID=341454 RepID=A0A4S2MHC7_9PEZI|nr:hypothetical protein EX30DRAFT_345029 [Ascodesmis nigricans]
MQLSPSKTPRAISSSSSTDCTFAAPSGGDVHSPPPPTSSSSLQFLQDKNSRRTVSNPLSQRSRRTGAGGFLLDNAPTRTSLDRPRASLDRQNDYGTRQASSYGSASRYRDQPRDVEAEHMSTDPAAVVSMILSGAAKRREEAAAGQRRPSDRKPYGPDLRPARSPNNDLLGSGTATRPFLMGARPVSSGSIPRSPYSALSPPPAPVAEEFPRTKPFCFQDISHNDLATLSPVRERQPFDYSNAECSEATIQRTEKAKKTLELAHDFKKLLELYQYKSPGAKIAVYNPLQAIRDRRVRARKKIQLDVAQWENIAAVERWIEDVADSMVTPGGVQRGGCLPEPPEGGSARILKRPEIEWAVSPEELYADFYWRVRNEEKGRDLRRLKEERKSLDVRGVEKTTPWRSNGIYDMHHEQSPKIEKKAFQTHRLPPDGYEHHYHSTASTDTDSSSSDVDFDGVEHRQKQHRRRRKFGNLIGGSKNKSRKKAKENVSKEEVEEVEWVLSDHEEPSVPVSSPFTKQQQLDAEDAFNSVSSEEASGVEEVEDDMANNSVKAAVDPFSASGTGLGISGGTADHVVPSIAISLSPPRAKPKEDIEERLEEKRPSNPKKLLSKGKDAFTFRDRDAEDSRESLEILRPKKSLDLKEKGQKKLGKVKSRVDKLRSEVSKVEDYIPWKRDTGSAAPSPTTSNFTYSDDDIDAPFMRPDGTASASEMDDERKSRIGRQSLEVPRPSNHRRPSKHRSHFSTSQIGPLQKRLSMTSDRDSSPSRREPKLPYLPREPSPIRNVHIESLHDRERNPLILNTPSKARLPPAITTPKTPEPAKPKPTPPPQQQQRLYSRDPDGTKLAWLRAGIVARGISESLPLKPSHHPTCSSIHTDLDSLTVSTHRFNRTAASRLLHTASGVNDEITTLIPQLREIADECHRLESLTTTEMSKAIGSTREDLRRLRRRGRWKIRRMARIATSTLGWMVTVAMWAIWALYMSANLTFLVLISPVILVVRVVWRVVRVAGKWLLWLE